MFGCKWYHYVFLSIIICLYFVLRLGWLDTVEFGYDQPRTAALTIEFLKNPTFINSFNFVDVNPWGFPSWGLTQLYFYAPFFILSHNPIVVSALVAIFNVISILLVFVIGSKFFNKSVGLIASLILATHPWWVIFSRMVYTPTPVPTFIALSMLLSFYLLDKPKSKLLSVLIFSWGFILQLYFIAVSFVAVSTIPVVAKIKKSSVPHLLLGIVLFAAVFVPITKYMLFDSGVVGIEEVVRTMDSYRKVQPYGIVDIAREFLGVIGGGRLFWELGYGFADFLKQFNQALILEIVGTVFSVLVILYNSVKIYSDKKYRLKRLLLVLWTVSPLVFLYLIKIPSAPPRYFLVSLPAFSILFGLAVSELKIYFVPILFSSCWIMLIVHYYYFIETYSYPEGILSHSSDPPYIFLDRSIKEMFKDASERNINKIVVSYNPDEPFDYSFNRTTDYAWKYVFNQSTVNTKGTDVGYYLLDYSVSTPSNHYLKIYRSGPYSLYRFVETSL